MKYRLVKNKPLAFGASLLLVVGLMANARAVDFRLDNLPEPKGAGSDMDWSLGLANLASWSGSSGEPWEEAIESFSKNATSVPGVKLLRQGLQQLIRDALQLPGGASSGEGFWSSYLRHEVRSWTSSHSDRLGTSRLWDHTSLWWLRPGDQDAHRLYHSWAGPQGPQQVPDSASTLALFSLALVSLGCLGARLSRAA